MRITNLSAGLPEGYLLSKALRGLRRCSGRPGFTFLLPRFPAEMGITP
ncbi:MAG: hypothetical protein KDD02_12680 [Phaeodactylibacter sp.]|nr:hypothetical protein [Phaeodactylibacter sp.]HQU59722.1 hypothetical protein [Saprospiraceae bacterium]